MKNFWTTLRASGVTPKSIAIVLGVVWVAIIIFGSFLLSKKEPIFIPPTEWVTYQDENVEFKYPKDWVMMSGAPAPFARFMKSGEYCEAIVFYNEKNPDVLLVLQSHPQFEEYPSLLKCWRIRDVVGRRTNKEIDEPIFVGARTTVSLNQEFPDVTQIYSLRDDVIEQFEIRTNDLVVGNRYQFSVIYPKHFSLEIQRIFDSIVESFKYLRKYQPSSVYPTEWEIFSNEKLGISFEYPSEWGVVKERITDYSDNQNQEAYYVADAGKGYFLSFSVKTNTPFRVYGVGQSADFASGREGIPTDYRGDPTVPPSAFADVRVSIASNCSESGYSSGNPSSHVIKFNIPNKEIGGVMLVLPVLSDSDRKKYADLTDDFMKKEINCMDTWGSNEGTEKAKNVYKKLETKEKEISEMLQNGVNFDAESKLNLKIYRRILESAKVF